MGASKKGRHTVVDTGALRKAGRMPMEMILVTDDDGAVLELHSSDPS
jgi:hypothetical protein